MKQGEKLAEGKSNLSIGLRLSGKKKKVRGGWGYLWREEEEAGGSDCLDCSAIGDMPKAIFRRRGGGLGRARGHLSRRHGKNTSTTTTGKNREDLETDIRRRFFRRKYT